MAIAGLIGALVVVVSPAADPASACDCSVPPDATAFEQSDAVFIGELVRYEPPPTQAVMSSADPATWIFEVGEVYKGEVAALQEIVSEVSGASCGLEIPRQGEFLVFATKRGFDMAVADGQYYAGLCGGTRATSVGPLAVDAVPSPPTPTQEPTSTTNGQSTEAAAGPTRLATGTHDDAGRSTAIVVFGVALALAVVGAALVIRQRATDSRSPRS